MNGKLNGVEIWPGVIGSDRSAGVFGWLIGSALGRSYKNLTGNDPSECPSHNFIIIEHSGQLWIGESVHPKSKLTTLVEYERRLAAREIRNLQLFEVHEISRARQGLAAEWWINNVRNAAYDWTAFFRLGLKAVFGDIFPRAAGLEWAHWCTEGIKDAYARGAGYDFYENENPTPLTTVKRWVKDGRLKLL